MPSLHLKWTSYLLAVAFMFGIAGNALAATNPMTLNDLSQIVLGLKKEVDRLSKENKTLSKKLERIETLRYAARTPSSAYQIGNSERLMKARLSKPVRVASLGTTRVAEKSSNKTKTKELENRITALEKKSHSEIRPYVRYDLAVGEAIFDAYRGTNNDTVGNPHFDSAFYPLSVGMGLQLNDSLRGDITFDYYVKDLQVARAGNEDKSLSNLFVLANAYYDFKPIWTISLDKRNFDISPYVGGGLGFSYFWGDTIRPMSDNYAHSLAVAAMAGVSIDLWEGLSADIGYRYAQLGFFEYYTMTNNALSDAHQDTRLQRHDFRMGLRYAF
ncbi:MAG: outer membrane beta-barrel protein [Pseudomonadota bacterium]|nr:outer membrane beta-barrel protein [Pseudomonadota bacterium]